jgi:hypothetical protein
VIGPGRDRTIPRRPPAVSVFGALAVALAVAGCGSATAPPDQVEACLRQEGLGVARQAGVSPPVETKINFDITSGTPNPERSGSVIFYTSEDEAQKQLRASGGSGPKGAIERKGNVLYTPYGAQASNGRSADQSRTVVESCVTEGETAAAEEDSDRKKRRSSGGRRR